MQTHRMRPAAPRLYQNYMTGLYSICIMYSVLLESARNLSSHASLVNTRAYHKITRVNCLRELWALLFCSDVCTIAHIQYIQHHALSCCIRILNCKYIRKRSLAPHLFPPKLSFITITFHFFKVLKHFFF